MMMVDRLRGILRSTSPPAPQVHVSQPPQPVGAERGKIFAIDDLFQPMPAIKVVDVGAIDQAGTLDRCGLCQVAF